MLRNAFFGPICGHPDFCIAILGGRLELVELLLNCQLRSALFDRPAVIRTFAITFWAADSSLSTSFQIVHQESHFLAARGHPRFCNHVLMAGLRRFRLAGARILKKPNVFLGPEYFGSLGGWCFPANSRGPNVPSVARFLKSD